MKKNLWKQLPLETRLVYVLAHSPAGGKWSICTRRSLPNTKAFLISSIPLTVLQSHQLKCQTAHLENVKMLFD